MNYLYKEHGYSDLEYHLDGEHQIEEYFYDLGADHLDCGEGYYTDENEVKIFVNGKSYAVTIRGQVGSNKQDRGDRMYYIDDITSVTYQEIPTPEPLSRRDYSLANLQNVTEDQYIQVLTAIEKICK